MADIFTRQLTIMTFEGTHLAVPLSDVDSIESTVDVRLIPDDKLALGQLQLRGLDYTVYGLSSHLAHLSVVPAPRTICVCLSGSEHSIRLAILCESIESIVLDRTATIQLLPECMQSIDTPLQALCKYKDQLILISRADLLATYLSSRE